MRRLMILVAVLVTMTAHASAQDLYKCKTPDGRTVISNAPCAGGSNETVIPSAVSSPSVTPSPSAVSSPQPATEERAPRPPVTSNPTVDAAFKALRKIMAATEVGINMHDYGPLVVEAKAAVNDIVFDPSMSKGSLIQKELEAAMQAYTDAFTAWSFYGTILFSISMEGKSLYNTYNLDEQHHSKQDALNIIWKAAKTHLTHATELAK